VPASPARPTGRDVGPAAPVLDRVLVVLGDRCRDLGHVHDLVRADDPQVKGLAEITAAAALAARVQGHDVVRVLAPGQVRARGALLLPLPLLPVPASSSRPRVPASAPTPSPGQIIDRRRNPGVPRVRPLQFRNPPQHVLELLRLLPVLLLEGRVPLSQVRQVHVLLLQHFAQHADDPRHGGETLNSGISGHGQHPAPPPRPRAQTPLPRRKCDLHQHKPDVD
jgi:hypothetical protein